MRRLRQDPRAPDFVQDPYGFYARAGGDLFFWEDLSRVAACSHRAVNFFLRDRRFGRVAPTGFAPPDPGLEGFNRVEAFSLLNIDGADHRRIRTQVLRDFTSRRVGQLEPEIRTLAEGLAARLEPGVDLLTAYCTPIPLVVIARLLGVPDADGAALLGWSHAMVRMYVTAPSDADKQAADMAGAEFDAYLRGIFAEKRVRPAEDLISALIATGTLNEAEMVSTCVLLLNAGHEATVHALGNAIRLVAGQPELCAPGQVAATVEEALRYDPPLHLFDRVAQQPCEAFGHHFAPGETVACLLGAANRDGAVFAQPDRFDATRKDNPQVSFGAGAHFCIGAPLARLEMQVALEVLFARWPGLCVTAAPYADTWHFHGLERLTLDALGQSSSLTSRR